MSDATIPVVLISLMGLAALRFIPLLRWLLYPVAVLLSIGVLIGDYLTGLVGVALFSVTYAMGKLQWRSDDRYEARVAAGERLVCRSCHGTGRQSHPSLQIMIPCGSCGGGGWRG